MSDLLTLFLKILFDDLDLKFRPIDSKLEGFIAGQYSFQHTIDFIRHAFGNDIIDQRNQSYKELIFFCQQAEHYLMNSVKRRSGHSYSLSDVAFEQ